MHCPTFSSEMAALLEDIMCLFADNRSDLEKILTSSESHVMPYVMSMEKAALDLKELVEGCMYEEEERLHMIRDQKEQLSNIKSKNLELEERLNKLHKQLAKADSELDLLDKDNRTLAKECDQKRFEIEKLYDELSHLQKLNCKLENCKDDLDHINKRLEDTIRVNRELEADQGALLEHNHELVREADREHAEVLRLQTLNEDSQRRIQAVIFFEIASRKFEGAGARIGKKGPGIRRADRKPGQVQ